jgi:crotonobetaine/carnitine-CoA ligase
MTECDIADLTVAPLSEVLLRHARRHGHAPFILARQGRRTSLYTYADALEAATDIARSLQAHGVGPGDRVHLHLGNDEWPLLALFGTALAGASVVPTDPHSGSEDLAFVLAHSGCVLSITDAAGAEAVGRASSMAATLRQILLTPSAKPLTGLPDGRPVSRIGESATRPWQPVDVDPLSPAAVMYTSGTTGWPKGVVITHANVAYAGECMAAQLRMRPDDRWLAVLPFSHANLLLFSLSSTLTSGASVAVDSFAAANWLAQAQHYEATLGSLFGGHIRALASAWASSGAARTRLRAVIYAARAGHDAVAAFERVTGAATVQLYGLTEGIVPPVMHDLTGERDDETCGKPTLWSRIRIESSKDPAAGELLIGGEPGRTLMMGYLNDPAATAAAIRDGWLHTGDFVKLDERGYLKFIDRLDDLIKPLAENVSTAEIERVLAEHPAVAQAAVTGEATKSAPGIKAFVVIHPGEVGDPASIADELLDWCRQRLADFKVPQEVGIVDALPAALASKDGKSLPA